MKLVKWTIFLFICRLLTQSGKGVGSGWTWLVVKTVLVGGCSSRRGTSIGGGGTDMGGTGRVGYGMGGTSRVALVVLEGVVVMVL